MKPIILGLAFTMLTSWGMAQSIDYNLDVDDPNFSNLVIGLEPFYIDMSKMNFPVGFGATIVYTGKPVMINASFSRAWLDLNSFSINATPDLKKHSGLELGAAYPFSNRTVKKGVRVTLSESRSADYVTTTYITVPGTIKRSMALRGGLYRYRISYSNEDFGDIELDGVDMVADVGSYQPGINQWEAFFGNLTVNALYAGIAFTGFTNVQISSKQFTGKRRNSKTSQVYLDVMFAPLIDAGEYVHVAVAGDTYNLLASGVYDLNDSYSKSRLGARLGWQSNINFKGGAKPKLGLWSRMEFGSRPGLKGGGLYGLLAIGIGINGNVNL